MDVLFDAIVANQDELAELVQARAEKPVANDGLFDRSPPLVGERYVGVSLRIKSTNVTVLDRLVTTYGAESRSQLVAAALSRYLL